MNPMTSSNHRTIIQTGITGKEISCCIRDSAGRWLIVEDTKML